MKINVRILTLVLVIFVSSNSFAQYKYDIGIRVSSYEMETFQLEQRFHLDNPYSIVATIATGSRGSYNYSQTPVYSDSLVTASSNHYFARNTALKIGLQRKLGFLATDVFYAGATVGVGLENQMSRYYSETFSVQDTLLPYPHLPFGYSQGISSSENNTNTRAINASLGLSFGMDVPITKRFSINAEIGLAAMYNQSLDYSFTTINLLGTISGGLRYSFGKRAE